MKKLIAYQKLLLNSISPMGTSSQAEKLIFFGGIFVIFFMNTVIFGGNTNSSDIDFGIGLPVICVWMINKIIYGDCRLFEMVPVSRKYRVVNVLLLPIAIICILIIANYFVGAFLILSLIGILYIVSPQSISQSPPESAIHQIIDTTNANLLMLCIMIIILFVGIAITFLKNKKLRLACFATFATIGYGLLFFLKINMPISPNSDKVEFFESFSVMPQGNIILICVAIATGIICIASCLISYNLYVVKLKDNKY